MTVKITFLGPKRVMGTCDLKGVGKCRPAVRLTRDGGTRSLESVTGNRHSGICPSGGFARISVIDLSVCPWSTDPGKGILSGFAYYYIPGASHAVATPEIFTEFITEKRLFPSHLGISSGPEPTST